MNEDDKGQCAFLEWMLVILTLCSGQAVEDHPNHLETVGEPTGNFM